MAADAERYDEEDVAEGAGSELRDTAESLEALAEGAYWSLKLTVSSQPAPAEAHSMASLPEGEARAPATDAAGVLRWWLALNLEWLNRRQAGPISIDRQQADGGERQHDPHQQGNRG